MTVLPGPTLATAVLLVTTLAWFLLQALLAAQEAVMFEVPKATPVTRPELLTLAAAGRLLFQFSVTLLTVAPRVSVTTAVNCPVAPIAPGDGLNTGLGVMAMLATAHS